MRSQFVQQTQWICETLIEAFPWHRTKREGFLEKKMMMKRQGSWLNMMRCHGALNQAT